MATKFYVGVSGFSYPKWKGKFYPKEAKTEDLLAIYSQRLKSVEINSSFYASPKAEVVEGWAEKTGPGFKFAFKAPQQITHILRLSEASFEPAKRFSKTLELLEERRGPSLFQLPPFLKQDLNLLEAFLSKTSNVKSRVFEFRNKSWLDDTTYNLLQKHDTAFCIAETEEMKPEFQVTGGFSYFRLRLDSYNAQAIDQWAKKIVEVSKESKECYVYLRHDETGENALLAQRLAAKLA